LLTKLWLGAGLKQSSQLEIAALRISLFGLDLRLVALACDSHDAPNIIRL
jgi:hypothetical protein